MDKKIVDLATELHGHLAPGIALGLRMCELALNKLGAKRGDRNLIAVSETSRCLADAIQAATGCTLGHGNALVEDWGKLAITIANIKTKKGIRVALKENAKTLSPLMSRWMMREGRLSRGEEKELGELMLELREEYLFFQEIESQYHQKFESTRVIICKKCGDMIPEGLAVQKGNLTLCKVCFMKESSCCGNPEPGSNQH